MDRSLGLGVMKGNRSLPLGPRRTCLARGIPVRLHLSVSTSSLGPRVPISQTIIGTRKVMGVVVLTRMRQAEPQAGGCV